jgi:LCP family protein required for cell wall assembly
MKKNDSNINQKETIQKIQDNILEPYKEKADHNNEPHNNITDINNEVYESIEKLVEGFDVTQWVDEMLNDEPIDAELVVTQEEDDMLEEINSDLAKQICNELDSEIHITEEPKRKRVLPKPLKIACFSMATLLVVTALLILTPGGRNMIFQYATNYAYGKMNFDEGLDVIPQEVEDDVVSEEEITKDPDALVDPDIAWSSEHADNGGRQEDGVYNILLIGEEAIGSGSGRGRTDLMIIATMNTKNKTYKLTSLMRDMLVQIPGYKDNKLNTAFEKGGVPLLYDTIELNFDIKLDGYAKVGFDDFEDIINKLGGVKISLTSDEANYLNSTNYISKPEYRNVVTGSQIMNGNQALGYCRIRYVATGDSQMNDYGRTSRQRIVLNAIFDQYKSKSLPELGLLLTDILPLVTTDMKKEEFQNYLKTAVSMGMSEIENLRIPADHTFEEGYVRKMSVLIPDLPANIDVLHNYIFGNTQN